MATKKKKKRNKTLLVILTLLSVLSLGIGSLALIEGKNFISSIEKWKSEIVFQRGEKGDQGENGQDGEDGKSAYQIWLDNGNTGSETDFLASLKGEDGQDGISVEKVEVNESGNLIVYFSNGEIKNAGSVRETHAHTYSEPLVILEANCTKNGLIQSYCTGCGHTNYVQVEKTPHSPGNWVLVKKVTATSDGLQRRYCTVCEAIYAEAKLACFASAGLTYSVNDDNATCTITGMGDCTDVNPIIGSRIDGYEVVSIGEKAFLSNTIIESITLPSTVVNIKSGAFQGCKNLKTVYYDGTIADWCGITFENTYANPAYYAEDFQQPNELGEFVSVKKIEIPDSVTTVGAYQFIYFKNITDVTMSDSVTVIGNQAFQYCSSLVNITLSKNLEKIGTSSGASVFSSSQALKNVYFRGTVEDWCNVSIVSANANPMNLASNFYVPNESGQYTALTEVNIPKTINKIGSWQFYGFDNLTSVIMSDSVETVSQYAFMNCKNLKTVTFSKNLKNIYLGAFYACGMSEISLPETLETLGSKAFQNCTNLTSVTIPNKVSKLETYAFFGCSKLTSVIIPVSVTSIQDFAFNSCPALANVYYVGTEQQWNAIEITSANATLLALTVSFNYVAATL